VCGAFSDNSSWDGTHGLINTTTNTVSNCSLSANIASQITFNYAPGATSVGVGFGNFQSLNAPSFPVTNHELFINGQDLGVLETFAGATFTPGFARNAYLRIDGTAGTVISSLAIENLTGQDVLVLDHVAVQTAAATVPEPSAAWFTALAILAIGLHKLSRSYLARIGTIHGQRGQHHRF
jgi:hypothetical protein